MIITLVVSDFRGRVPVREFGSTLVLILNYARGSIGRRFQRCRGGIASGRPTLSCQVDIEKNVGTAISYWLVAATAGITAGGLVTTVEGSRGLG